MGYAPVRYVEAVPIEHQGQPMILVRDPERICPESLVVPLPVFLIMTLLDGRRGAPEIQEAIARASGGQILPAQDIDRIVNELDEFCLLLNERSATRRAELELEFEALPTRPATHAGQAYPDQVDECRKMFDGLFEGASSPDGNGPRPRGLIVPHIDLRIGGRCLARTLARLDPLVLPRLYILLGVAHQPAKNLFTLTHKSFESPLGLIQTDVEACRMLREACGSDHLDGEYVHKHEHSVEFPAVALKYFHRERPDFKILPILCGHLEEDSAPDSPAPRGRPEVGRFVDGLRRLIDHYHNDVCIVASVDLAHVGRRFGDEFGIDDLRAQTVQAADDRMLELVAAMDPEAFFDHFRRDGNARHVDAVTAVYVQLHALGAAGRVERVDYQQSLERDTDSLVSFAGLAIY